MEIRHNRIDGETCHYLSIVQPFSPWRVTLETLDDKLANAVPIVTMTKYSHKINVAEEAVAEKL